MRRFAFPLERVARLRRAEADAARGLFLAAVAARRAAEETLAAARAELADARRRAEETGRRGIRVWEAAHGSAHLERLAARAAAAAGAAEEAAVREEEAREAFLRRRRDARALEVLRERALRRWRAEVLRRERIELDEAAAVRWAVKGGESE